MKPFEMMPVVCLTLGVLLGAIWQSQPAGIVHGQGPLPQDAGLPVQLSVGQLSGGQLSAGSASEGAPARPLPLGQTTDNLFTGQPSRTKGGSSLRTPTLTSPPSATPPPAEMPAEFTPVTTRAGRDVAGSGDLIGFSHVNDSGTQVITLVNTQKLWMAVYHIGSEGKIRLVSSRAIDADFSLQLNALPPLPEQIRRMQGNAP